MWLRRRTPRAAERIRSAAQLASGHDAHLVGLAATGWPALPYAPAEYLARHGVRVDVVSRIAESRADEAIPTAASSRGADLIVMGAYGRSRCRELLMGGATRTMLESMTVPVWMAH